jgi:hypothetical protein
LAAHRGEVDEDTLFTFRHTFFVFFLFVGVVGGFSGSGSGSPPNSTSVVTLMNHEALLLPILEFKEYIVDTDVKIDFFGPNIYPRLDIP